MKNQLTRWDMFGRASAALALLAALTVTTIYCVETRRRVDLLQHELVTIEEFLVGQGPSGPAGAR